MDCVLCYLRDYPKQKISFISAISAGLKPKNKMKNILSIIAAVLFTIGMALATGVDQNPIQAIYALVCMGAACVCIKGADAVSSRTSDNKTRTTKKVYDYQAGTVRDVA